MAETTKGYLLKELTPDYVNAEIITKAEIDGKIYTLERSGKSYCNSPVGRQTLTDELPDRYADAVFAVWGDTATVQDPEAVN